MAAPATGIDSLPSLEAQLQRLFLVAQERELAMPVDTRLNNVGVAYNFEELTASFTLGSLPITIASLPNGKLEISPGLFTDLP